MPFNSSDRKTLRAVKGVGDVVITRLEQLGYSSLNELAQAGVDHILARGAALTGSSCWKNSPQARAAIAGAIAVARSLSDLSDRNELRGTTMIVVPDFDAHGEPMQREQQPKHKAVSSSVGISELPGLGAKSAHMLAAAGITSVDRLRYKGAVGAFLAVKNSGQRPSLNLLWALEGALTGVPWQEVSRQHRTSLLLALEKAETELLVVARDPR